MHKHNHIFKNGPFQDNIPRPPQYNQNEESGNVHCGYCNGTAFWREPPSDHILSSYFRLNTMHGLKYVSEPKRHLSERLCWLLAFLVGIGAAAYMINDVWENYKKNPVIVSFQPTETDITDVPFPAVTVCNMNRISRKLYETVLQKSTSVDNKQEKDEAKRNLHLLKSICESQPTFSQLFQFAFTRGTVNTGDEGSYWKSNGTIDEILTLLIEETDPCHEMLRLCVWAGEIVNCSKIFVPIVTEYGKCCTFNILPYPLLLSPTILEWYSDVAPAHVPGTQPDTVTKSRWSFEEIDKWRKWDFTTDGFIIPQNLERPYRQSRAGVPFGLSVLVDPNTDEYFCPSSDSEGFRVVLHTALEVPPVSNWGVGVGLGKEIYMDVQADLTLADASIAGFDYKKRLCYFQAEKNLDYYTAYTTSNCLTECAAKWVAKNCSCTPFYMPRPASGRICSSAPGSEDQICVKNSEGSLTRNFRNACPDCDSLCSDIFYNFEATQANLQPSDILWASNVNGEVPNWANHKISIVHLYFGSDSFVPKIRNQLYAMVDLIANTGGLLGLCLGFSALSLVELVYFFTIRLFWQKIHRRAMGKKIAVKFIAAIKRAWNEKAFATKPVDPSRLPNNMYPKGFPMPRSQQPRDSDYEGRPDYKMYRNFEDYF